MSAIQVSEQARLRAVNTALFTFLKANFPTEFGTAVATDLMSIDSAEDSSYIEIQLNIVVTDPGAGGIEVSNIRRLTASKQNLFSFLKANFPTQFGTRTFAEVEFMGNDPDENTHFLIQFFDVVTIAAT